MMADGKSVPPLEVLHSNLEDFFNRFLAKYRSEIKCGFGCSQCCISGLTVFPVEARHILIWFQSLSDQERSILQQKWRAHSEGRNSPNVQKCVFLIENACSIYPARPVLCRTQGLPLKVVTSPSDLGSNGFALSLCELNFSDESKLPSVEQWLDLERVNILLSIAEKFHPHADKSPSLDALVDAESGRISLSALQEHLLQN